MATNSDMTTRVAPYTPIDATPKIQREHFLNLIVSNPKLEVTINEITRRINSDPNRGMIISAIPTGVGKSVAGKALVPHIIQSHFQQFPNDAETIHAIMAESAAPQRSPLRLVRIQSAKPKAQGALGQVVSQTLDKSHQENFHGHAL